MIVTMSTVRSNAASLGGLTERGDGVAAREVVERLGDAGARLLELGVRLGARRAPEQVAVEADVDVVVVDRRRRGATARRAPRGASATSARGGPTAR